MSNLAIVHNRLLDRYAALIRELRQVVLLLRRRRPRAALSLLESVLDGEGDMSGGDESEPEATDEPMTVDDVQAALLSQVPAPPAPPAPVAFVGRSFRLDDAPGAQPPAPVGGDAPDSAASDASQEPMCCRCGDRENLHVFARSGPWLNVESEAGRTYCLDCLNG